MDKKEALVILSHISIWRDGKIDYREKETYLDFLKFEKISTEEVLKVLSKYGNAKQLNGQFKKVLEFLKNEPGTLQLRYCAWLWVFCNSDKEIVIEEKQMVDLYLMKILILQPKKKHLDLH